MNNIKFNDELFKQTNTYKEFINNNPSIGYLNIKAYAANFALPINNMEVEVSKVIDNYKVIFFEGLTNSSGTITKIELPTPPVSNNDLDIPQFITYDIIAKYNGEELIFKVDIFSNIVVVQNINVVPNLRKEDTLYGN